MLRVAFIGAGNMAFRRAMAFMRSQQVVLCGVASKSLDSANRFAKRLAIPYASDDFKSLLNVAPDIVIVEVPHFVQDSIVIWALENGIHVLLGSFLATNLESARQISNLAQQYNLIVECGFEARYKKCWIDVKNKIDEGVIGKPSFLSAMAIWAPPENSWYLSQIESGGMPLTHMSYAFVNPLRWLFGYPLNVYAISNDIRRDTCSDIRQESCISSLTFADNIIATLTCSYLSVPNVKRWHVEIHGTQGMIELHPEEFGPGRLYIYYHSGKREEFCYSDAVDPFDSQVQSFLRAINTLSSEGCMNTPQDSIDDIRIITDILRSVDAHKSL